MCTHPPGVEGILLNLLCENFELKLGWNIRQFLETIVAWYGPENAGHPVAIYCAATKLSGPPLRVASLYIVLVRPVLGDTNVQKLDSGVFRCIAFAHSLN